MTRYLLSTLLILALGGTAHAVAPTTCADFFKAAKTIDGGLLWGNFLRSILRTGAAAVGLTPMQEGRQIEDQPELSAHGLDSPSIFAAWNQRELQHQLDLAALGQGRADYFGYEPRSVALVIANPNWRLLTNAQLRAVLRIGDQVVVSSTQESALYHLRRRHTAAEIALWNQLVPEHALDIRSDARAESPVR